MKLLRRILDNSARYFDAGGRFEKLHPFYEAADTLFYAPGNLTRQAPHVRDTIDLKRMMGLVVFALMPCVAMALYNTGYQANLAIVGMGEGFAPAGWRAAAVQALGLGFDPAHVTACVVHGAMYFFPVLIVSYVVGGHCEVIFALIRKHEINEGFFVTGLLFPLVLPPTIPLWQVAVGIAFGVILGKEIFGGTGMNIFNPALMARLFLFFAYPAQISGEKPWVALDGYSGPTMLARAMEAGMAGLASADHGWWDAFWGFVPGSMGETSAFACLLGAVLLLVTKVASWRTMLGVLVGSVACGLLFDGLASRVTNPFFDIPIHWHLVLGGWAFGAVFMATDPVSSAYTDTGKLIYGLCIGGLAIMIRVLNPAYPEGMMLAIILMNLFAPLIDHFVVQANIKRRLSRNVQSV